MNGGFYLVSRLGSIVYTYIPTLHTGFLFLFVF